MPSPSVLYHVSPAKNRANILSLGLDPIFSLGKEQKLWLVSAHRVMWALAHCSARHHMPVNELDIWTCQGHAPKIKKTSWSGVFTYPCRIKVYAWNSAAEYVKNPK